LAGRRRTAQGLARRARIVLAAADGMANKAIGQTLGADENTVSKWRRRFAGLASTVFTTSRVPERRGGSAMTRSPRRSV